MRVRLRGWIAVAWLAVLAGTGCSSYSSRADLIQEALLKDDYEAAIKAVEKIDRKGSELLYCYELGLVLHEQGDYSASNAVFERSEQVFEELYTKSVSREVGALLVNEGLVKYRGDAFEAVLVNYYKILNYLFLGDVDGAQVECRRLNFKLQLIHDAGETYFANDPFLQYLTALVYETGGDAQSAEVSYRASRAAYDADSTLAAPPWLGCDAAQNALRSGDGLLAASYSGDRPCNPGDGTRGRVAVLIETGAVARKVDTGFTVPIFENDRYTNQEEYCQRLYARRGVHYDSSVRIKYWLRVALPALRDEPPVEHRTIVRVTRPDGRLVEEQEVNAVMVENLDSQAYRAYKEKEPTVIIRALARALAKYLASETASNESEELGTIVNLFGVATETSDTRSWTTLPGAVELARLDLEPGTYTIDVEVIDPRGLKLVHQSFDDVDVRPNGLEVRRVRLR